jgi:SAM-dependent methyltransferase
MQMLEAIKMTRQSYTPETLYNTMHVSHVGYRGRNQGLAVASDWFHLLRDKRGVVHNPWTDTPITILEFGCGNGQLCDFLKRQSIDVTGTDIFDNEAVYDRSGYKFVKHDLTQTPYPFKDNEFGYGLSFDVLEHLEEKYVSPALQEMARISRHLIIKVACSGEKPLHLTIKSPGWWFNQLIGNCPDFSWQLVRNFERVVKKEGPKRIAQSTFSDARPLPEGYEQVYAPLFYGKKGVIASEG